MTITGAREKLTHRGRLFETLEQLCWELKPAGEVVTFRGVEYDRADLESSRDELIDQILAGEWDRVSRSDAEAKIAEALVRDVWTIETVA